MEFINQEAAIKPRLRLSRKQKRSNIASNSKKTRKFIETKGYKPLIDAMMAENDSLTEEECKSLLNKIAYGTGK